LADSSGAVDLGVKPEAAQEEELAVGPGNPEEASDPGPQPGPAPKEKVDTAFTVVVTLDGNVQVILYEGEDFLVDRNPTPDLVYGACAVVQKDMQAQETAQATVQFQMAQARAIAQQQQEAAIRAGLHLPGQG
jgi:hypothetical protein